MDPIETVSWKKVKLGEHVDLLTGFPFKSSRYSDDKDSIKLLRGDNVAQGYLRWEGVKRWTLSDSDDFTKYWLEKDDVILAMDRPWIEAGLKNAWVKEGDLPCLLVQRVTRMRGAKGLLTNFLRYIIVDQSFTDYIKPIVTGVSIPHISASQIQGYTFQLPPIEVQSKIAAILSAYDDLIENNTQRIKILEEMAQALYREWFVKFRFPGHEKVEMVESELGMVPEGWDMKVLGELLKHHIGGGWGKEKENNDFSLEAYVIRGTDIPQTRYASIENCPLRFHKESNLKSRRLKDKDIVFEVSGGSKGQPVGRALFISQKLLDAFEKDVICASFCKLLRVNNEIIIPEIIYLHLLEIYENGNIEKYQTQSTGIINFKFSYFTENELIMIPEKDLQIKFNQIISPIFNMIQSFGLKNANLRRTRDLLLPKLISGEVDVENIDVQMPNNGGA